MLTNENKQKRVECSRQLLQVLEGGFKNIITREETWIYFYTVANKQANKVWLGHEENRPQIAQTAKTAKNACFVFFFLLKAL